MTDFTLKIKVDISDADRKVIESMRLFFDEANKPKTPLHLTDTAQCGTSNINWNITTARSVQSAGIPIVGD